LKTLETKENGKTESLQPVRGNQEELPLKDSKLYNIQLEQGGIGFRKDKILNGVKNTCQGIRGSWKIRGLY